MQEHQTAAYIESRLAALGIEHFRCGGTGVVGVLRNGPGPVIAFRAGWVRHLDRRTVEEHVDPLDLRTLTATDAKSTYAQLLAGEHPDTNSAIRLEADEAERRKTPQRLAHRRPRDRELLGQVLLPEDAAGRDLPGDDRLLEREGNVVGLRPVRHR